MNRHIRHLFAGMTAAAMLLGGALAESITFSGTVAVKNTHEVYAPIGGTVEKLNVEAGQRVSADDSLLTLAATKVYASESGTVTGVFGQPGDSADSVSQRYGAVMYIEGDAKYTVAASTENAYDSTATKFVHAGESVFIKSSSSSSRTGTGVITSIQGIDYSVEVTEGTFLVGETVYIYRGDSATTKKKLGSGELSRSNPTAVTAQGSIVSFAVQDGDTVQRGDLLFETLDGTFDGLYMSGKEIYAGVDGIVGSLSAQQGGAVQKNNVVAVVYPNDAMQIEAQISEYDLTSVKVGDPVTIELLWNQDEDITYDGTVTMISAISNDSTGGAQQDMDSGSDTNYSVFIDFTPDESTRFGMSAVISTRDDEPDEREPAEEETEEVERGMGERPEGADSIRFEGGRPELSEEELN